MRLAQKAAAPIRIGPPSLLPAVAGAAAPLEGGVVDESFMMKVFMEVPQRRDPLIQEQHQIEASFKQRMERMAKTAATGDAVTIKKTGTKSELAVLQER